MYGLTDFSIIDGSTQHGGTFFLIFQLRITRILLNEWSYESVQAD